MNLSRGRHNNYDFLRVIATIAVILLHASELFASAITDETILGDTCIENMFYICIIRGATVFAVPCFMMLSGAFLLDDEKNADYAFFYKKRFKSIGVPTLIFSALYTVFNFGLEILRKNSGGGTEDFMRPIRNLLIGEPYGHMWYLFMLLGIYVMVPVVLRVKSDIGLSTFYRMSWYFLILASLSGWTLGDSLLKWNIGYSFCFLGYLMIGYTIRKWAEVRKHNRKGISFLLSGGIILFIIGLLRYGQGARGIADFELKYSLLGPFNPLVVVASVLIFAGFSLVKIRCNLSKLSAISFYIYLFHGGVLVVVQKVLNILFLEMDNRMFIMISTVLTFGISWIAAQMYIKVWNLGQALLHMCISRNRIQK